jgi:hypothetical protein
MELRALCLLAKRSSAKLYPQSLPFWYGSLRSIGQVVRKPRECPGGQESLPWAL